MDGLWGRMLIVVMSLTGLMLCCVRWFDRKWIMWAAILLTSALWGYFLFFAAPSTEMLSGFFFWLAFSVLIWEVQKRKNHEVTHSPVVEHLLIGFCLGIATLIYPPILLMIVGGMAWCFRYGEFPIRAKASWLAGFLPMIAFAFFFGRVPEMPDLGPAPFSTPLYVILAGTVASWVIKPKLSLTWCTIPYSLLVMWLPESSLSPVISVAPLQIFLSYQELRKRKY